MRLNRLRLKGFKSFASLTVVDFAPGICAVVGPNGSGKSNIVDAIAWVLGTQSPRSLRLNRMEDVIFAGSQSRSALGRAEVVLEFDNTDGQLPGPSEISVARSISRTGESEYRLNGDVCRLSDLMDLLSAANFGRAQHIVISQGEIDSLVNSRGGELRQIIEDAGRISGMRRRKEITERQLASARSALEEVKRKERELRKWIAPLKLQMESAQRKADLQSKLRSIEMFLARRRLEDLKERLYQAKNRLGALDGRRRALEQELANLPHALQLDLNEPRFRYRRLVTDIDSMRSAIRSSAKARTKELEQLRQLLSARAARVAKQKEIANERARLIASVEGLECEAEALAERRQELAREAFELGKLAKDFSELERTVRQLESQHGELRLELSQKEATNKERQLRHAQALSMREKLEGEIAEKRSALLRAKDRLALIGRDLERHQLAKSHVDAEAEELESELSRSRQRSAVVGAELRRLTERIKLLEAKLDDQEPRVIPSMISTEPGRELAAAAILGYFGNARVFDSVGEMVTAARDEPGDDFIGFVVQGSLDVSCSFTASKLPESVARRLDRFELVDDVLDRLASGERQPMVDGHGFCYDDDFLSKTVPARVRAALELAQLDAERRACLDKQAQIDADVAKREESLRSLRDSSGYEQSEINKLHVQMRSSEAAIADLESSIGNLEREFASVLHDCVAPPEVDDLLAIENAVNQIDAELSAKKLLLEEARADAKRVGAELAANRREQENVRLRAAELNGELTATRKRLAELSNEESRLAADPGWEENLLEPRINELENHLRELEEMENQLDGLAAELARSGQGLDELEIDVSKHGLSQQNRRNSLLKDLDALAASITLETTELARLETMVMTEEESAERRFGISAQDLLQSNLPEGVAPTVAKELANELAQEIATLGEVNPLAEGELLALEGELASLNETLEDARVSEAEMRKGLRRLENDMRSGFRDTLNLVSEAFDETIARLFNGGTGALVSEDDGDPMEAPVSIQVALPRKRVTRLAALSGGERSLISLAFLLAVLKVRPVPFVVLDEVEAALDEHNLVRFGQLIRDVSADIQVIVVTHQRKTMELADLLIGVSMVSGGSSKVVRYQLGSNGSFTT